MSLCIFFFFFNDTATTEIYTLSLHDALPIWIKFMKDGVNATPLPTVNTTGYIDHAAFLGTINPDTNKSGMVRSEERFSRNAETDLVCRLLLEKKKGVKVCILAPTAAVAQKHIHLPRDRSAVA